VATGALLALALSSCTTTAKPAPDTTQTNTIIVTHTRPPAPFAPAAATSVAPLGPDQAPAKGEVEKPCPYIASSPDQNPNVNVADIEGDHVYRTTVLTTMKPVGCRFYFYAGPFEAIADILTRPLATPLDARNAMVSTATKGSRSETVRNLVPGVDAILFKTEFFGPDGPTDWACVFAKGSLLVTVHTQQTNASFNAKALAAAIAPKI
jgi:hypothetical protein